MSGISATKRQIVVVAGPSGGGKNSIIKALQDRFPHCARLVTATTRQRRGGEEDGIDKYFFEESQFLDLLRRGDILEHRFVSSLATHYGIYKQDLERRLASGDIILAELDIVGARFLKEHYGATTIFIEPGSIDSLRRRVRGRNPSMSDDELEKRMAIAEMEMREHAPQYDYRVVNVDGKLDRAVGDVVAILRKEGYTLD